MRRTKTIFISSEIPTENGSVSRDIASMLSFFLKRRKLDGYIYPLATIFGYGCRTDESGEAIALVSDYLEELFLDRRRRSTHDVCFSINFG
jgi:hypothetical protein